MIYLAHEITVWQAESQRIDALVAQLMINATQQDQASSAATARANSARADAARLNGEAATFTAQAAAADAQAASFDQQITQKALDEPDKTIETGDGKFKPNPLWPKWKAEMEALTMKRDQARAAAAAARTQAAQINVSASQSQAAAAAADKDAANATTQAAQLRAQAAQAGTQKNAVTQQIAAIMRWQQEIARQPLDRNALETSGRELAAQITPMEAQYTSLVEAAVASEKKQWYLQTLVQELSKKIADLNGQLPPAATEVANAAAALADVQTRIQHVIGRQPE